MSVGIRAERLLTDLCSKKFLRGFVFHSPRYRDPTEIEAGDVVIWARREVIVFELIKRESTYGSSTKQFVKRIGTKRDQLTKDFYAFKNPDIDIELVNEQREEVYFDNQDIDPFRFSGIVIVDCDDDIKNLHYKTVLKLLSLPFPAAIMTQQDLLDLLEEVDTIPDMAFYLRDRFEFLKQVYLPHCHHFLNLNSRLERNLIAFYKIHDNKFPPDEWRAQEVLNYHLIYTGRMRDQILARNAENDQSFVIDKIIDCCSQPSKLHAWELASTTRRERAGWSNRIQDAFDRMLRGNQERFFAFKNGITGCWLVFFFQYGGDISSFIEKTERLTKYKLFLEIEDQGFEFSVFGYGFWKSSIITDTIFDRVVLTLEDACDYNSIPEDEYEEARQYFGRLHIQRIQEFPNRNR